MNYADIIIVVLLGAFVFLMWKRGEADKNTANVKGVAELQGTVASLSKSVEMLNMSFDRRMEENSRMIQNSQKTLGERLDNSSRAYADVKGQLEHLSEASKKIFDLGKDIACLQDTLKAPKLRGVWGELFLEEMLRDRFSNEQYQMQYKFKSGHTVDAVIFLRDKKMIPVDSKFSLENFKKLLDIEDEEKKNKVRKLFLADVKKRIDEIASKYILPDENTMNFALMYIPAENVYYEVMVRAREVDAEIMEYALTRGVFPVSPNTFSIYLTTVLSGLRGLEIEKRTQDMMGYINSINVEFGKFGEDYEKLGKHLGNAGKTFTEAEKRLDKLQGKIHFLSGNTKTELDKEA